MDLSEAKEQAISINSKYSEAYYNRAILKKNKLNDIQGALSDYNRSISINPKNSEAYSGRAALKFINLNDRTGSIQDLRQAAQIDREQENTQHLQKVLDLLRELGVTE